MTDNAESSRKRGLVAELGYRHVWRAAAVYASAVWALSQGIAQLGPFFGAPDRSVRWFVIACVIGFFWIAFAWYYKLTPQGFKRAEPLRCRSAVGRIWTPPPAQAIFDGKINANVYSASSLGSMFPSLDGSFALKLPIGTTTRHAPSPYSAFASADVIVLPSSGCAA
ncbi:MAG: hypothetical protein ACREPY_12265 [Rhodanobacteraceae bacterium]